MVASPILFQAIFESLGKCAVVIINRGHFPGDITVGPRATDYRYGRRPLVGFAARDLNRPVIKFQGPLTLGAVADACANARAAIYADNRTLCAQKRLIEHDDISDGISRLADVHNFRGLGSRVCDRDQHPMTGCPA